MVRMASQLREIVMQPLFVMIYGHVKVFLQADSIEKAKEAFGSGWDMPKDVEIKQVHDLKQFMEIIHLDDPDEGFQIVNDGSF
jgi:hypothetical protein